MARLPNEACREQALLAIRRGDIEQAIAWINTAYARTIGHKKRDRYAAWADKLARENEVERHTRFADDGDV